MDNYIEIQINNLKDKINNLYFNKNLILNDDDWYSELKKISDELKYLKENLLLCNIKTITDGKIDVVYIPLDNTTHENLYEEYKIYKHNTNIYIGSIYYKIINGNISYYIDEFYSNTDYILRAFLLIKNDLKNEIVVLDEDNSKLKSVVEKIGGELVKKKNKYLVYKLI